MKLICKSQKNAKFSSGFGRGARKENGGSENSISTRGGGQAFLLLGIRILSREIKLPIERKESHGGRTPTGVC